MSKVAIERISDTVREFVRDRYLEPARRRGDQRVSVSVGEVHKALGLTARVPLVCSALRGNKFLDENKLRIVERSGPPSGMSTTVTFTYEFAQDDHSQKPGQRFDSFMRLRGIARDIFRDLGGGEEFIRSERRAWQKNDEEPRS